MNHDLQVNSLFWDRDSHGLFDYESKSLVDDAILVSGCTQLVRDENALKTTLPKLDTPKTYQKLISVVYNNGSYWVYNV